jgi:PAS domain S-box-containing protein
MSRTAKVQEDQREIRRLPVILLVLLLGAAGIVAAFGETKISGYRSHVSWDIAVSLLVLMAAAGYLNIRFRYRNQGWTVDLMEAILAPTIVILPGLAVVAVAGLGVAIANAIRKNTVLKASFNVTQYVFAAGVGSLVFSLVGKGFALNVRNVVAVSAVMLSIAILTAITTAGVISIAERQPLTSVSGILGPSLLLNCSVNLPFGLLFFSAYRQTPAILALFLVPMLVLSWSHRSYAAVLADKARLSGMHRATRALAGPINPRDAIPTFLEEVRKGFAAEEAELVLIGAEGCTIHRANGAGGSLVMHPNANGTLAGALVRRARVMRLTRDTDAPALVDLLTHEGHRDAIAAPLINDSGVIGVVCAYDCSGPEGFEDGELAVLETLAREAASAIAKAEMLEEIVDGRRKLAEIVEHTSDGIVTMAPDGAIQIWNRGMERITGYPASEVVGSRAIDRLRPRDEDGKDVMMDDWAAGLEVPGEVQIRTAEGETCWLACAATPVADQDGRPRVLIMVMRDVTKAHEVERLKDDFVATVSHELRTPLTPIKGFAATLVDSGDLLSADDRATAARSILNQAEHLERLVVNLLEVAKLERGAGGELRDEIVDIRSVAERVALDFRGTHPDRAIVLDAPKDLRALGDELFIGQIISNLVSNAIKYTPAEEPIEIRMSEEDGGVTVSVVDHGPGIPATEIDRIFDRFHRLGNVLTRATGGTGLGLYIARQLASSVGGTLHVDSTIGEGSTFTLRLRPARRLVAVS